MGMNTDREKYVTDGYGIVGGRPRHADCKCHDRCQGRFRCAGCKQMKPWCLGASDDRPEYCDTCWNVAERAVAEDRRG
jgi:hypothetical protein